MIDLVNGYLLTIAPNQIPISIGQIIRGLFTIIFFIELLAKRKINKHNQYIFYFLALSPLMVIIYYIRDSRISSIPIEIIALMRPLFFLLLINLVITNYDYFKSRIEKILTINLLIFSSAIISGYIFGIAVDNYKIYYKASKGLFYAANSTAIVGLTFCIYFTYMTKRGLIYIFYSALAVIALFLSGSMIILIYPIFLFYFLSYKIYNSLFLKTLNTLLIIITISLFLSGKLNSMLFINNSLFNKYQARVLNSVNFFNKHSEINIIPLRWYSYVSGLRAIRANTGINNIFNEPENIAFGFGSAMRSEKVGMRYAGKTGSEMDFIDVFLDYGIIGFLFIYIPILRILFPILLKLDTNKNAMIIYFIFLYSCFAGHVITAPMGSTLFALFLGIEYGNQLIIKEKKFKPLLNKLVFN